MLAFPFKAIDMKSWTRHLASLKAASAVYTALIFTVVGSDDRSGPKKLRQVFFSKLGDDLWTPTLKFYSTYDVGDMVSLHSCTDSKPLLLHLLTLRWLRTFLS